MENKNIRVCIITFSSRKDGNCEAIGNYIREIYCGAADLLSFTEFSINSCGKCNYECFTKNLSCPYMDDMECTLIDNIISHDLTYFIVPNYNDYPCANFFAFSERQQWYFRINPEELSAYDKARKRFIVVSNTEKNNFRKVFSYHVEETPKILYLSASHYGKNSLAGDILFSDEARQDVKEFILDE